MTDKNMEAVNGFKNKESLKFLRGMCFNNAAVIVAGHKKLSEISEENNTRIVRAVFNLARNLLDEAIKVKFNEWGENK